MADQKLVSKHWTRWGARRMVRYLLGVDPDLALVVCGYRGRGRVALRRHAVVLVHQEMT